MTRETVVDSTGDSTPAKKLSVVVVVIDVVQVRRDQM